MNDDECKTDTKKYKIVTNTPNLLTNRKEMWQNRVKC